MPLLAVLLWFKVQAKISEDVMESQVCFHYLEKFVGMKVPDSFFSEFKVWQIDCFHLR